MHLEEEQLQRLLHGELAPPEKSAAREHVAACQECRRRLDEAEREEAEVHALLRAVDTPPPGVSAEAVALEGELLSGIRRRRGSGWLRRAAGIAVAVGVAGAAYAIPGSPVRKWAHAVVDQVGGRPSVPEVPAPGSTVHVSGIAVSPGERLSIIFGGSVAPEGPRGGVVHVALTDASDIQISAPAGAAGFVTKGDFILIATRNPSATYDIGIPRSAPWVEILAGEKQIFLKEGPHITTSGTGTGAGDYILQLSLPSSP